MYNTMGDLGSISKSVDTFINLFTTLKETGKGLMPPEQSKKPLPGIEEFYKPSTTEPSVPSFPSTITPTDMTPKDKFIEAISPIRIQFVSPLEIKTSGVMGVSDPNKPSTITPISSNIDTSQPVTVYTIDKTPVNTTAKEDREKDRKLWEKWQYIGLAVSIGIPIMVVFLTWNLNKPRRKGSRKKSR